jgi:outer membrane autotransporter protein
LPPTGVTPEVPVVPRPPIAVLPPGQRDGSTAGSPAVLAASVPCAGRVAGPDGVAGEQAGPCVAPDGTPENEVPLTPGRDLVAKSDWNAWADTRYLRIDDHRGRFENKARNGTLTVGFDRLIDSGIAAGIMASLFDGTNRRFSGFVSLDSTGVLVGPYLSYRLSQAWSLFGSATIGTQRDEHRVVSLVGSGDALLYGANLNALGQYEVAESTFLRPRVGISYQHKDARSFALSGPVLGRSVRVDLDRQSSDSMIAEASLEVNSILRGEKDRLFVPFIEAGIRYTHLWPEISGSTLTQVTGVDWQGILRLGGRALLGPTTQIEINASYQSIGVSNLDIWEAGIFVSHAF